MKGFYEKSEPEKEAFVMAKELDKAITEALIFEPESVKELEHKKQLITEWKKKEADLQKFLNNNKIKSVCFGGVYMRGNINNTEVK